MRCAAILVAAGSGVRMGAGTPKALMALCGRPLLAWAAEALMSTPAVELLIVVGPPGHEAEVFAALPDGDVEVAVVPGGETRAHSVALGLEAVPPGTPHVLVTDAARPLIDSRLIEAVLAGIAGADGAIAASPLADTPTRVDADGVITETPPRAGLWLAQTPQAFRTEVLREAVMRANGLGRLHEATDCASLVEAAGGRVRVVANPATNLKVTTPSDARIAELLLRERSDAG
jgi:2-C-methyl-D-erythritol 4-phosphate cytidylyltransferase